MTQNKLKADFPSAAQILHEAMEHLTALEQRVIPETCRMRYIHRNNETAHQYDKILITALARKIALLEIRDARANQTITDEAAVKRVGDLKANCVELNKLLSELKDLVSPANNVPRSKP